MNKVKLVLKMILLGISVEIAASYILTVILGFIPGAGDSYATEIAGLMHMTPKMLMIVCILAPVLEELFFRGLILGLLKKFAPFIIANVTQALAFGIYHGKLIQGIYAFLLGMLIGYIAYVTGSFVYTIVLHMGINSTGMLMQYVFPEGANAWIEAFAAIVAVLIIISIVRGLKLDNDRMADS